MPIPLPVPDGLRFVCLLLAVLAFAAAALWRRPAYETRLVAVGLTLATVPFLWDVAERAFK